MIIFADTGAVWTFRDVDEYSNRVARLFFSLGHSRGDIVALFMTNRPEYVAVEVGLAKIGIVVVLVNHNLRSDVSGVIKPIRSHLFNLSQYFL
jgi:acyl-coenzyme A synthetase/AMP-(fatty) acid ligase